jgi:hypothetical protein
VKVSFDDVKEAISLASQAEKDEADEGFADIINFTPPDGGMVTVAVISGNHAALLIKLLSEHLDQARHVNIVTTNAGVQ